MKKILTELLKTKKQKEKERRQQYLRFRQMNGKRIFKTIQNNPDWT